jgi:uncharacterized membrane protein
MIIFLKRASLVLLVSSLLMSLYFYPRLPESVPTQSVNGIPSEYKTRLFVAFFRPAVALILWALVFAMTSSKLYNRRITSEFITGQKILWVFITIASLLMNASQFLLLQLSVTPK